MKKLFNLPVFLILIALFFTGCASKPKVLSSKSSKHVTVEQTNMGVYIVVHKESSEDIKQIQLIDSEHGNGAIINMEKNNSVEFMWPYADSGKTYTIKAYLTGNKANSTETVTFKTDSVSTNITDYNADYLNTKLVLIATGNKRVVKLNTTKEALLSCLGPTATFNAKVTVDIFSGKHFYAEDSESTYIGSFSKQLLNVVDLNKLVEGYDIISTSPQFGLTPEKINDQLSQQPTYFARACVAFKLSEKDSADVTYTTKYIYTNDTVYTPIDKADLPAPLVDAK